MFVKLIDVAVALATTEVMGVINTESSGKLGLQVANTGANPLDKFEVWGKIHLGAEDVKLLDLAADFTTPVFPCLRSSGSPVTLGAGATPVWMVLDVMAFATITIKASSSVGPTTLSVWGSAKTSTF